MSAAIPVTGAIKGWLQEGDLAPDFTLLDQSQRPWSLGALRGRWVVLFFYPHDGSFGCTAEACEFRDQFAEFKRCGAEVIGISSDSIESHQIFAAAHRLPYPILSDAKEAVRRLYGVPKTLGVIRSRVTFIIDPEGRLRRRYSSQFNFRAHSQQALEVLQLISVGA